MCLTRQRETWAHFVIAVDCSGKKSVNVERKANVRFIDAPKPPTLKIVEEPLKLNACERLTYCELTFSVRFE